MAAQCWACPLPLCCQLQRDNWLPLLGRERVVLHLTRKKRSAAQRREGLDWIRSIALGHDRDQGGLWFEGVEHLPRGREQGSALPSRVEPALFEVPLNARGPRKREH